MARGVSARFPKDWRITPESTWTRMAPTDPLYRRKRRVGAASSARRQTQNDTGQPAQYDAGRRVQNDTDGGTTHPLSHRPNRHGPRWFGCGLPRPSRRGVRVKLRGKDKGPPLGFNGFF